MAGAASSSARAPTAPERADIVWMDHDPHAGKEMRGRHPMLVLSTKAFNERTGLVVGLPMTHAEFNADNPFVVAIEGPRKEVGYVLCHQPKSFDWKIRNLGKHPWGQVSPKILREALQKLDAVCGISD